MATQDVPGANPANKDELHAGCWAEHEDGSLIFVKGAEGGQVVYELYDVAEKPPIYYQDAMREEAFKTQFSYPKSIDKWTWHDKTPFPWDRVITTVSKPRPMHADVQDTLSAAARVAESLKLRTQKLTPDTLHAKAGDSTGRSVVGRLQAAFDAFMR